MVAVLSSAQRLGFLGSRSVPEVVEHARGFVSALSALETGADRPRIVDIGSGGGVPGLVIAVERPDAVVTLVDRRQKRTDFLARAVASLGLGDRVEVRCTDARVLAAAEERFDAVTARGFGPPIATLRLASRLVRPAGLIVISEPPSGDRWPLDELARLGLDHRRIGPVAVFRRPPAALG